MDFGKMMKLSKEFYDTIDFTKFMGNDRTKIDLDLLIDCIDVHYSGSHPELLPKEFCGEFFYFMTSSEFAEYLGKRYNFDVLEETYTKTYLVKNGRCNHADLPSVN